MRLPSLQFWHHNGTLDTSFGFLIAACIWPKRDTTEKRHTNWGTLSPSGLGDVFLDRWYYNISPDYNLLFVEVSTENLEEVRAIIAVFRDHFPDGLVVAFQPGDRCGHPLLSESDGIFATMHELPVPGQQWDLLSKVEVHLAASRT